MQKKKKKTPCYSYICVLLSHGSVGFERESSTATGPRECVATRENVPDRLSAKVAPVGCQLATMALKTFRLSLSQKVGLHGISCHPIWDTSASGLSCTRLADFLPPWQ